MERFITTAFEDEGQERMATSADRSSCGGAAHASSVELSVKCALCMEQCASRDAGRRLRDAGIRPTRQRVDLAKLLFGTGDRHVSADMLHEEAVKEHIPVSLATVYNTLQQFTSAGLLRRLATDTTKAWFDTNVSEHHHLLIEDDDRIVDVPPGYLSIERLPPVPEDMEISRVEVVVRLRRRGQV
jgi:Fur family iron response transcriptional regulator